MTPAAPWRRAAAALLALSAIATAGAAARGAASAPTLALVETLTPETMTPDALALHIEALLAESVDAAWLARETEAALAAAPADWGRLDALAALASARGLALPPETAARLAAAQAARPSMLGACLGGVVGAAPPDDPTAIGCYFLTALTPVIGETKDLSVAALRSARGEPVDWVVVGLAGAGLGAMALGPASLPVRYAAATVKTARRAGALTRGLADEIAAVAARAAQTGRIAPKALRPLLAPAAALGDVAMTAGPVAAVRALRHVDGLDDARRLARVSAATGAKPGPALEALGLGRIFRPVARISRAAVGVWSLAAAAVAQLALAALAVAKGGLARALRPGRA